MDVALVVARFIGRLRGKVGSGGDIAEEGLASKVIVLVQEKIEHEIDGGVRTEVSGAEVATDSEDGYGTARSDTGESQSESGEEDDVSP